MSIMYMHLRPVVPALRSRSSRRLRRNIANRRFVQIFGVISPHGQPLARLTITGVREVSDGWVIAGIGATGARSTVTRG